MVAHSPQLPPQAADQPSRPRLVPLVLCSRPLPPEQPPTAEQLQRMAELARLGVEFRDKHKARVEAIAAELDKPA